MPMEPNNLAQEPVVMEAEVQRSADNVTVATLMGNGEDDAQDLERQSDEQVIPVSLPRLELKLPIVSSSSSESEPDEIVDATAGTSGEAPAERAASPPPNCAICLGRCKNKCFTDSCMHQFCFKCLCEWSKVKPECPLCKQTFKSIIHNVKSIDQFEEYHVQPPLVQIAPNQFDFPQVRMIVHQDLMGNNPWNDRVRHQRFIHSASIVTNLNGGINNRGVRNINDYNAEIVSQYRHEFPGGTTSNDTLSQLWRRFVYDRKLYALPVCDVNGRFRDSSAQFYRDNPAQIHRLAPWINRDIVCLLRLTQHDVTTVIESIHTSLSIMNILSPAFRRRLTPYLGNKTSHFIHELHNFARSPHDIFGYDGVVQYSTQTNEDVVIQFISSDESTDNEVENFADNTTLAVSAASTNAINLTIHNRLSSTTARGGEPPASNPRQPIPEDVNLVIDLRGETEEQSAAAANSSGSDDVNQVTRQVAENIELTSGSSDECEFVLERKPPHLRTPEMVSLDSATDSDVVFVEETKPLNKTTFSTTEGEEDDTTAASRTKRPNTRSKITALVEAKKRTQQSANTGRNETHGSSELYNVGASTSAALRLSIQRRSDVLRARARRTAYYLRQQRHNHEEDLRKMGFARERSHSSNSMGSNASSFESSSSTSDEEFVASTALKQNVNPRKRKRTKKTKAGKSNCASKRTSSKRKKTNNNESSNDDDDNGHMGKNFALVMAIGERLKRQKARQTKYRPAGASDDEEDSDGENTWRMEAVYKPLRKQQQEAATLKATERKRKARRTSQQTTENQEDTVDSCSQLNTRECDMTLLNNFESSSDESDNLKLIELKSILTTNRIREENKEDANNSSGLQVDQENNDINSQSQNASEPSPEANLKTPESPATTSRTAQQQFFKVENEDMESSTDNEQQENEDPEDDDDMNETGEDKFCLLDEGSRDGQIEDFAEHIAKNEDHELDVNEYSNETTNLPSPIEQDNLDEDREDHHIDDNDDVARSTQLVVRNPLNLSHEAHGFDGNSMSTTTTTTDTILNETAEQISSAAVNFYSPLTAYNTADFADDNTSDSTSSESSVSTTTTTSSSNSSSCNTNGFVNNNIS